MHVAVMGAGYVGLVTAGGLADLGLMVTSADINQERIQRLGEGKVPIFEPGLEELVRRNTQAGRLSFSADIQTTVRNSLVIFVAVGTNGGQNGEADLSQVWSVADSIADCMEDYKVIVTKSTVPVGTAAQLRERITSRLNGLLNSMWFPIRNFLGKARRSKISFTLTASSLEAPLAGPWGS